MHYVKPWTPQDDQVLREISGSGQPARIAADILGRSRNSILGRAHRLNISFGREFSYKQPANDHRVDKPIKVKKPRNRPAKETLIYPLHEMPEAAITPYGQPRELLDLEPHHCRWACFEIEGTHQFCCADRMLSKPYCVEHQLIAYSKRRLREVTE